MTLAGIRQAGSGSRDIRETLLGRLLTPAPGFELHGRTSGQRESIESFVAARFEEAYGARLPGFFPQILGMRCLGELSGAVGMRAAGEDPLFLEQYLGRPAEQVLTDRCGVNVPRTAVVELGNLVASKPGASQILFLIAASMLAEAGYRSLVFTATRALRNNLEKLGFPMKALGPADPDRLIHCDRREWGSYYRTDPVVMAGSLSDAMDLIAGRPLMRRTVQFYGDRIAALAGTLRREAG